MSSSSTLRRAPFARIADLATTNDLVAGHDFYPTSVHVAGERGESLTIDERLDAYAAEARRWYPRYRVPFWVAETSNLSLPVETQEVWLDGLARRLDVLRAEGLPVRGLCWYSRGDQFDWQTMLLEPTGAVTEVGLFDAQRTPRPVADAFAQLAARARVTGSARERRGCSVSITLTHAASVVAEGLAPANSVRRDVGSTCRGSGIRRSGPLV